MARLREAGAVETHTDPADRRRTLISPARTASPRVAEVRSADIDGVLTRVLEDPERLDEVKAALRVLAEHLGPSALTRLGD
ncbi:hypothetical protein [Streptomyces gardneri]|uniref:HTH marR-type domain-containing protein n=1 Tax=Streptomyces gardneri TaxID=66892 RepID=A0A4Y3RLN7_9ACTN|nr:hypothetical protein [Streptomyces gardneri]GEB57637.1 hypothetical protein SGA01_32420 [Streptomyces gardneri]GHH02343.1 hypothetical protein GCM10017674_39060 [Streptomyces gardneri]